MRVEKLCPPCKPYLWGGERLKKEYHKKTEISPCAESWELSYHPDGKTTIEDGKTLEESAKAEDLGVNVQGFPFFPLLIKLIDAKDNLSVQVHPSDEYALKNENSFGKTETWYIVDADDGAGIYLGFKDDMTKDEYERAIKEHTLTEKMNFFPVKKGECYFIPSGTLHAIGKGCLICEVQQNSNLTYRVYDYGRKGADGKERELHIDKALAVTDLKKFEKRAFSGALARNKYFTMREFTGGKIRTGGKSFACLTLVEGTGEVDGKKLEQGESVFVSASADEIEVKGGKYIMTEVRKYAVGIDLGGTFIKGGIVDDRGEILIKDQTPTEVEKGDGAVADNIAKLVFSLLERAGLTSEDVCGIGMGVPGMIDSRKGEVVYSNNLPFLHFPMAKEVENRTKIPTKIANDANVAALGEAKFGCGKEYENSVMLTLGTGVGGGILIDGELFEGTAGAGAELGHTVICVGGEQCTCGRKGCLEAYASATALTRDTRRAMEAHKDSKMWETYTLETANGKTPFDYKDSDPWAKEVVDHYIEMLGEGILNVANAFRPQAVMLGGGVCAQGDNLILPLKEYVLKHLYGGSYGPKMDIVVAKLGNSAGLLGAAALVL